MVSDKLGESDTTEQSHKPRSYALRAQDLGLFLCFFVGEFSKRSKYLQKSLKFVSKIPINKSETKSRWKSSLWKERDKIGDTFTRRS